MISGIIQAGLGIIDKVIPDPEAKAEAKRKLIEMEQQGQLKELEVRMSAIVAEANSSDPWTSRARPSFMWCFYLVILGLVLIAPMIGVFFPDEMERFFSNVGKGFEAIPEAMWATFTAGYLGYGYYRHKEKRDGVA